MNRIFYRSLTTLARLAVRSGRSKDIEIIVLRPPTSIELRRLILRLAADNPDHMLTAVDYVEEFVAQSDEYPLAPSDSCSHFDSQAHR